ncbi:Putative ribosomal RNA methyltransferase FtsJ domain, ribosomal RNA methyltransferase, Spb1 [Septoria linicola]|uniref:Ribosomal RNA methyltransferase FtsJ domain, ribosomal RNA methyltransferase, Spb1 n=1 Tax=Septoria linicola TaxID=215465 RepID=A0A9Q9AMW5_9PEZI|nr:Putative ribosomal RNA methyltransferase FtsJ domain, ribosomal RNA methyltransferase, Spb1 [Septoria linicola]
MAIQKKHAKARLDKYYYLAKEKGYRSRAAFKLIQLNKKYSFLQNAKCLIDLCAAPGGWLQVAAEIMPQKSLIVGVDLSPIKAIPKTITFQSDITTDKCRATIRGHLKTWKADCVIHDGAPNVGTAWVQDAFSQNELVLSSLKLATEFLAPNGAFVTKVFRSKDSAKLEWIFKQLFNKVEQTKPPSSRNVSAETFYVCRGYKAPKHLDPKFLDPHYAFMDVKEKSESAEAKVFNPEKKKRKREGYEEGDWTQFHEAAAYEFVQSQDPIEMLGTLNRIHFRRDGEDSVAQAALDMMEETTKEVRTNCEDLKVLGRADFKLLLRWRIKARERFGLKQKKSDHTKPAASEKAEGEAGEEVAVVESMDDEMRLREEIQAMKDLQDKHKKKDRRRENEKKQREIVRMQMGMTTPSEIGIEAGLQGGDAVFRLRDADKDASIRRQITKGRMTALIEPEKPQQEFSEDEDEDEDGDRLERELDNMYQQYQEKLEDRDTKARAKRVRKEAGKNREDAFEGFGDDDEAADSDASDDQEMVQDQDDSDWSDEEDEGLTTNLQPKEKEGELSNRAASFFQQDIFSGIDGLDGLDEEEDDDDIDKARDSGIDVDSPELQATADDAEMELSGSDAEEDGEEPGSEIEEVAANEEEEDWEEGTTTRAQSRDDHRTNIQISTAEAMTLAHQLATGKVTQQQLLDDNFNKYSLRDVDGLPEWFLDDENKHARPQRPVTKEAAAAIKEKMRAVNARPIKKVREAKARKTLRAARRLEKLKKKSEGLAEDGEGTERDKANQISKLMAKASKSGKKKQPVKVIRAGGQNKGQGRPRGVKGKYKMVDPRLKKDVRGLKRAEKKQKKK